MSTPHTTKRPFLFRIFLVQLAVAFLILLLFSAYVWGVQLKYDATKIGYERAFFYSLLVFGAGFSYDCAKKILFLDQPTFISFAKKFGESVFDIIVITLLCAGTAFLLNIGYIVAGQLLYIGALGWVWFAVKSITEAIEVSTNERAQHYTQPRSLRSLRNKALRSAGYLGCYTFESRSP